MALDLQELRVGRWCLGCLKGIAAPLGIRGLYICLGMGEWRTQLP